LCMIFCASKGVFFIINFIIMEVGLPNKPDFESAAELIRNALKEPVDGYKIPIFTERYRWYNVVEGDVVEVIRGLVTRELETAFIPNNQIEFRNWIVLPKQEFVVGRDLIKPGFTLYAWPLGEYDPDFYAEDPRERKFAIATIKDRIRQMIKENQS
jgi:hypothetical protein